MDNDYVSVEVKLTRKQRDWLNVLGEDLREDLSAAVRGIVNEHIAADEKDPLHVDIELVRSNFESCVTNRNKNDLNRAKRLLSELEMMLDIGFKEEEAKQVRRRLADFRMEKS